MKKKTKKNLAAQLPPDELGDDGLENVIFIEHLENRSFCG
jgi:hypothetical protein